MDFLNQLETATSKVDQDPITIIFAIIAGIVPSILWLVFWLREDKERPEPKGLLFLTFVGGMISVMLVLPLQKFADSTFRGDYSTLILIWAGIEEVVKFFIVYIIALRSRVADEPLDFAVYCITGALGFAALENALFLIQPIAVSDTVVGLLTGNLRFLGATLLHGVSTSIIGIMLGLTFGRGLFRKSVALLFGLFLSISLHGIFNLFIIKDSSQLWSTFGMLWAAAVIIILLFEKLRRMSADLAAERGELAQNIHG